MNINRNDRLSQFLLMGVLLLSSFFLASCSETDDTSEEFPEWQSKNESYFNNLYAQALSSVDGKETWKVFKNWSYEEGVHNDPQDYIVVKVLEEGTGTESPLYTDSVRVHYQGRLLPSVSYASGYVFDQSWTGEYNTQTNVPYPSAANSFIDGFTTALLHMHKGDRWQVYIPYQLGYGTSVHNSIPAYSTLIFDITLDSFYHPDEAMPPFHAKNHAFE